MGLQSTVATTVRSAAIAAFDLLLPEPCGACGTLPAPGGLCAPCKARLPLIAAPFCRRCGAPFEPGEGGSDCARCLELPPPWGEARAAWRYDGGSKGLLLAFKYGDRMDHAGLIAAAMAAAGAALLARAELLVPVPLHRSRLHQRRYNQSALLVRRIARLSGRPACLDALRRVRRTAPLAELGAAERAAMLQGAITAAPRCGAALAGHRVLLVDDVLTSGATARACTAALFDAGAQSVDLLVAARAARAS